MAGGERSKIFRSGLFGEPAWDMLLALYCLPSRGWALTVTGLCHAAEIPLTTGHRWQEALLAQGLMKRGPHLNDGRQHLVALSDEGRRLMETYLLRLYQCEARHIAECEDPQSPGSPQRL